MDANGVLGVQQRELILRWEWESGRIRGESQLSSSRDGCLSLSLSRQPHLSCRVDNVAFVCFTFELDALGEGGLNRRIIRVDKDILNVPHDEGGLA